MPIASGTWGSLPTCVIAAALWLAGISPFHSAPGFWVFNGALVTIFLIFSAACILQGAQAEARWGKDPSEVVADETAGQCLPLMFLPAACFSGWERTAGVIAAAFLLFRILDITKPWPARQIQRCNAGWGILLDDLIAGVYAAAVIQVVTRLWFV